MIFVGILSRFSNVFLQFFWDSVAFFFVLPGALAWNLELGAFGWKFEIEILKIWVGATRSRV